MKAKCSYLSIDLDYWNFQRSESTRIFFRKLLKKVGAGVPIDVVVNHHELLPFVDDDLYRFDELINLDYHDDLGNYSLHTDAHEGNWVSAVPWRHRARYVWRYPHFNEHHCNNGICGVNNVEDYAIAKYGWQNVRMLHGSRIDFSTVEKIGISISPCYLEFGLIDRITCRLIQANFCKKSFHTNAFEWLTRIAEAKSVNDLPDSFGQFRSEGID